MKNKKLVVSFLLTFGILVAAVFGLSGIFHKRPQESMAELNIVATLFPGYDLARTVTKNTDAEINLLIKPGTELHDFEPTAEDLLKIQRADLFIYNGGESEAWAERVIGDLSPEKVFRMMDFVDPIPEEDEDEDDEHIWTSPQNMAALAEALAEKLPSKNQQVYQQNVKVFQEQIAELDAGFRNLKLKQPIILADRYPFRYFAQEYDLTFHAAFNTCAEETEVSPAVLTFLIEKIREYDIGEIFILELSNGKVAETLNEATGAEIKTLYSAQNISKQDFDDGVTYLDLMQKNLRTLQDYEADGLSGWVRQGSLKIATYRPQGREQERIFRERRTQDPLKSEEYGHES